jgi:four helix bundle protein
MQDFKKLNVWQKAHQVAMDVYKTTGTFPKDELYGLTSQIRRAAISIPSNIAEGCGREGAVEFSRFCQIAMGSAYELEYQLLLAHDLNFLKDKDFENLNTQLNEVRKMLLSFIQKLKADTRNL